MLSNTTLTLGFARIFMSKKEYCQVYAGEAAVGMISSIKHEEPNHHIQPK
jgi:hypothetical protein